MEEYTCTQRDSENIDEDSDNDEGDTPYAC